MVGVVGQLPRGRCAGQGRVQLALCWALRRQVVGVEVDDPCAPVGAVDGECVVDARPRDGALMVAEPAQDYLAVGELAAECDHAGAVAL